MAADSLRDRLQAIYDQFGQLTPDLVVHEATDPEHPLHDRFQWDDQLAGAAYRRQQAHELIRSVRIVYKDTETDLRSVRAFHAVRRDDGYVYEPAEKVAADPFARKLLLSEMEREWKQLRRRYEEFGEFVDLVAGYIEEAKAA